MDVKEFLERMEAGEGAYRGKYDWSALDPLINGNEPFTVADCERLMPDIKYRNYIRNYLERLVRNKVLVRTPKNQPRTFYLNRKVFEKALKDNGKKQ